MDYSIRIPAIVCRTVHIMCNFNHFIDFALFYDSGTCFFMHFECFSFFSLVIMAKKNLLFRHSANIFRQKRRFLFLFHKNICYFLYIFHKHFNILCKINLFRKLRFHRMQHFFCQIQKKFYFPSIFPDDHGIVWYILFIRSIIIFFQLLCTGIVGEYLSKTYLETKKRPIFILKDSSDEKEQKHERM